jgi:ABC-2 type transport system ATP-binding protein
MIDYIRQGGEQPMTLMIEAEQVVKSFRRTRALRGVDLAVPEGQVTGLLGPNGAGKTTLVRILATLVKPDSGRVRVAGRDVADHPQAVRRAIGLAGQYALVDETLTGRENLEMTARLYHLGRAEARRQAAAVLDRLSLADAADRPVRTYSGGMRRRLDLGASLVGRPRVLLLDEPTTGLDPAARNELWAFIRDLVAEGATLLLTTQLLEEADQLAADVVIIDHGAVVAHGTPEKLKAQLGYDLVQATVGPDHVGVAAAALSGIAGPRPPEADPAAGTVSVRVPPGSGAVPAVVRALDQMNVPVTDVIVRRPSLDDIFLALTGSRSQS